MDNFDAIIKDRIESLRNKNDIRYYFKLSEYFSKLEPLKLKEKYGCVLDSINYLWISSDKDSSIFKNAQDFEPILQNILGYRDHFIHSFNVFLLGYYIINRLKEINPDFNFKTNNYNLTWMLASTFHDVAYPIETMDDWLNQLLEKFLGIRPNFYHNIMQLLPLSYGYFLQMISSQHKSPHPLTLKESLEEIDFPLFHKINAGLIEKNHGVLGALMLAHLLATKENKNGDAWDFLINNLPACHAVCMHNLKSIDIEFSRHPFAFLLVLCDELQDEGRPSKHPNQDTIRFINIDIIDASLPKVQIKIEITKARKKSLKKSLKRIWVEKHVDSPARLIEIKIIDMNDIEFLSITPTRKNERKKKK
jgi:hypothetical protein